MILIVGCGFLGNYLLKYAVTRTSEPIVATVRDLKNVLPVKGVEYVKCDITKREELVLLSKKVEGESLKVFYFAACHNIDFVYENPEAARKVNVEALEQFLLTVPGISKLFFASTDCVYGENTESCRAFSESAALRPVNEYGKQKLCAEKIVQSRGFTAVRLPFMLGPSLSSKPHFYDRVCGELKNNRQVEMIDGLKRSVLSFSQAAKYLFELSCLSDDLPETVNICSDYGYTKYEVGCLLAKKTGASSSLIKKISEEEGKKFFKDKRASSAVMDNALLKKLLGVEEILWEDDLCL